MKTRILWFLFFALAVPGGIAAQSIRPFFMEDDLVFKPELLGEWKLDGDVVEFRDLGNKAYGAVLRDGDQSAILFRVHLFRIEQKYFLDAQMTGIRESKPACTESSDAHPGAIAVTDRDFELDSEDSMFLNHQHLLLRAQLGEDKNEFSIAFLKKDWVRIQEEAGRLSVAHTRDDNRQLLLIAESDDLRAWVRELPEESFERAGKMQRAEAETNVGAPVAATNKP